MYVDSPPLLFFAKKDFVELAGTSEDLATGISIFFATTGSREIVGELDGEGVGVCDGVGEAVGISFPESHIRTALPLLLPLMQVYRFPLKMVVWPRKRHLTVGVGAAKAGNTIETRAEINPKPRIRLDITLIEEP